jgi:hypothetical protein
MRLLIDSIIAFMLVGLLVGVMIHHRQESAELNEVQAVHRSLGRLHEAATLHRVLDAEGDARRGYLRIVKPQWFGRDLPVNVLLGRDHPWIDVAPPGDLAEHPPDPVADASDQAGFWYNPGRGIFRARVMRQVSERETLALYNRVNGCALGSIVPDPDPARQPVALTPADATTALASPEAGVIERATPAARPDGAPPIDHIPEDEVVTLDFDQPDPPSLYEPAQTTPGRDADATDTPDSSPAEPAPRQERRTLRSP